MFGKPKKIRIVPDEFHIFRAGVMADGRQFWIPSQIETNWKESKRKETLCRFVFSQKGDLIEHDIETIAENTTISDEDFDRRVSAHLEKIGQHTIQDITVRPFSVEHEGTLYGLVPQKMFGFFSSWTVIFEPGNSLCFTPPFNSGNYDT